MGENHSKQALLRSTDPLAWSAGLLASLASCLLAPELLSRLLPETSYRPPLSQTQDTNEVSVDWIPYESPRLRPRFVEAKPGSS